MTRLALMLLAALAVPVTVSVDSARAEESSSAARGEPGSRDEPILDEGLAANEAAVAAESESGYGGAESTPEAAPSRLPAPSSYTVGFAHQFDSDVEGGGEFDMWRAWVDGVYDVGMAGAFAVVTRFDYNADVYDFSDAPNDGANGFPLLQWGVIHTPRLEPLAAFEIGDAWRVYAGPVLEFSFEGGANVREAFRPGGLAAAEWTIHDDLRVGLGLIVVADLDSRAYFSPILLLDWNLTDDLALHMESWSTRGGEIELGWRPLEQLEVAGSIGFQREYYRLNERTFDANPLPDEADIQPMQISEALVRDRAYTGGLRLSWLPQIGFVKNVFGDLRVDVEGSATFAGELTIDDSSGSKISELGYDAAPSVGLSFYVPL